MSAANTASPSGARSHARAMAGVRVESMPILPPWTDEGLPAGVDPQALLWRETLGAGGYASKILGRGARLRLEDLHGDGCVSMLIFNAAAPTERLNVADTLKVQWNAYLRQGGLLLSDMGRVLMSILDSDAPAPDALCGGSNQASNTKKYGDGFNYGAHPNARDRFGLALAKHGLNRADIHPCINWFKGVTVEADGSLSPDIGPATPGRGVTLRAEMDLIVVLANCPHVLDPRADYAVSPVRITAWRGEITSETDPVRTASPEGLHAFLNVEDYYRR
jgi:urea carboxylase-associated protein 2